MAKREFEVTVTRTGFPGERERAYREALRFLLLHLPAVDKSQDKDRRKEGREG